MIYANTSSLTGPLTYGTVYQIMLLRQRVLSFKSRLDKFWKHQELMYNYSLNCTEPGTEVSVIGNFVTSIKKMYVRSRLRGFAYAC